MMVVNASISKTDYFYKNTITGLCGGTTYEFAAWVMNLLRSSDKSPPDITFMIETTGGTILNSYSTGSIPLTSEATWKQFGFYFTTPANTSNVVIRMRNNSAGGAPANDLALDDITFRACGPTVTAGVNGSSLTNYTICAGARSTFSLQGVLSVGYSDPQYQWQVNSGSGWQDVPGATAARAVIELSGASAAIYQYRLAVGESTNFSSVQCRVYTNVIKIAVEAKPDASFTVSNTACTGQPVYFLNASTSSSGLHFYWDFGDSLSSSEQNPVHVYTKTGSFISALIVVSENGCTDSVSNTEPLHVLASPTASFSIEPHEISVYTPTISFADASSNGTKCEVLWGDGYTGTCWQTSHVYTDAGTYTITQRVGNSDGCYSTAEEIVIIKDEFSVFIPNVFSPNQDGLNDVFLPVVNAVRNYDLVIYDRWGQLIFESKDPAVGWDGYFKGELCPKDIYVYKLSLKDAVSYTEHKYTGKILLFQQEFITQY